MIEGLEGLLPYASFYREYVAYKESALQRSIRTLDTTVVLPKNAMMHLFDSIVDSTSTYDFPNLKTLPFLVTAHNRKVMLHMRNMSDFDYTYIDFPHKKYSSKLVSSLTTGMLEYKKYKMTSAMKANHADLYSKSIIALVNYNPLLRVIPTADKRIIQYKRMQFIVHNVLKNVLSFTDKYHFLHIPLDNLTAKYTDILRIPVIGKISNSTLKYNDLPYCFLVDLFMYSQRRKSVFDTIDLNMLSHINLMFTCRDKMFIINLEAMMTMLDSKSKMVRVLSAILQIRSSKSISDIHDSTEDDIVLDISPDDNIDDVIDILTPKDTKRKIILEVTSPVAPVKKDDVVTFSEDPPPITPENIDKSTDKFIQEATATPAQKRRAATTATKYKSIKLGDTTIGEILKANDTSLSKDTVSQLKGKVLDESMLTSNIKTIDRDYKNNVLQRDILMSVMALQSNGMFLVDYKQEDEVTSDNNVRHITASFEDVTGKPHTVNIKLPLPDDEGFFRVDGVGLSLRKQFMTIPISKVSATRVSLVSNFNKTLVEKNTNRAYSLTSAIRKHAKATDIKIVNQSSNMIDIDVPYEYSLIGNEILTIATSTATFYFDHATRLEEMTIPTASKFESKYGTLVGKRNRGDIAYFMSKDNMLTAVNTVSGNIAERDISLFMYLFPDKSVPHEWCTLKLLDKSLPVVFILSVQYGLLSVLDRLGGYRLVNKGSRLNLSPTETSIPFSDTTLVLQRYPLSSSYILDGLKFFSTKDYTIDSMEDRDTYFQLLDDKGYSFNYIVGIENYFKYFVDPITAEILETMGEPTNSTDLLYRAVEMLTEDTIKHPSALINYRTRGLEKLPAIIYNEMARQHANYSSRTLKTEGFSLNTEAVYQRIIQDQAMSLREESNPIHAMKEQSCVTFSGFGGRTSESFVERDRKYPTDGIGILSEATPIAGNVALVAYLSGNPNIEDIRGTLDTSGEDLSATEIFSDTTLLIPGSTNDDPKRAVFTNIQLSHHVPSEHGRPIRVRTGMEAMIPHKTTNSFAVTALEDGVVLDVDDSISMFKVRYKSGKIVAYEYGDRNGSVGGTTLRHTLQLSGKVAPKRKIKKDDILAYHKGFFSSDPIMGTPVWNHGVPAKIMISEEDGTLEDGCIISQSLADKLSFPVIYKRRIKLSGDMTIKDAVRVGTKVDYDTILCKLDFEDIASIFIDDPDTDSVFEDMKYVTYAAKHTGTVVGIDVYHTTDDLSPSVKTFIMSITKGRRKKARFAKDASNMGEYVKVSKVAVGTKISKTKLYENEIVLIFDIESNVGCGIGDKVVLGSSLKTVIGEVVSDDLLTESGDSVQVIFSATSIFNRIVLSPMRMGLLDRALEKVESDIVNDYFG